MIFPVSSFEIRSSKLERSGFFQAGSRTKKVLIDDFLFMNSISDSHFSGNGIQLFICEECGQTGCARGSWSTVRRIGCHGVFVPAVELIRTHDYDTLEYSPPRFMYERGFPAFEREAYQEFRYCVENEVRGKCELSNRASLKHRSDGRNRWDVLPRYEEIPEISSVEVLELLQFKTPGDALGKFCSPVQLVDDILIAVTDGDLEKERGSLQALIAAIQDGTDGLHDENLDETVEFHLDVAGFPVWRPFGYRSGQPVLNLASL